MISIGIIIEDTALGISKYRKSGNIDRGGEEELSAAAGQKILVNSTNKNANLAIRPGRYLDEYMPKHG